MKLHEKSNDNKNKNKQGFEIRLAFFLSVANVKNEQHVPWNLLTWTKQSEKK